MQFFAHLSIFSEKIKLAVHWKKMKRLRQSNLSNTCYKNCKETYILNARCVCVFFFWFEFYVRGSISLVSRWNSCNAHLVIFFSLNSPEFHENQLIFSFLNWILINANQFKRIIKIHFRELLSTEKLNSTHFVHFNLFWRAPIFRFFVSFAHSLSQSRFWNAWNRLCAKRIIILVYVFVCYMYLSLDFRFYGTHFT